MKKVKILSLLFSCMFLANYSFGQYYKDDMQTGVNKRINVNTWNPNETIVYIADSTKVNQIEFGRKTNKRSFKVVFPSNYADPEGKAVFTYKKTEIQGTQITKNSGIKSIELTNDGFEVTYITKKRKGIVDDYVIITTLNGRFMLRLVGEIVDEI